MSHLKKDAGGHSPNDRTVETLIHTGIRCEGLLVPQTESEVERLEEELINNPVDIPPEILDPAWLFNPIEPPVEPARPMAGVSSQPTHAIAARDGNALTESVIQRMRFDRERLCAKPAEDFTSKTSGALVVPFGSPARFREIEELAESIAQERCPNEVVDPERIASTEEIGISFNDYEEAFDGLLECMAGGFHIYGNLRRIEGRTTDRARFTLAHELGHYFIDEHRRRLERGESLPLSQCDYESAQPIEREADRFAAHLLMPTKRFAKQARGTTRGLSAVLALKQYFKTSVTSTACRYSEISGVPCVVMKWSKAGFCWKVLSPAARESCIYKVVESISALPSGSATARALAGEPPPSKGYFETGTTASTWFRGVSGDGVRNVIMIEQAMPLGRFGVLTMLYPETGSFSAVG